MFARPSNEELTLDRINQFCGWKNLKPKSHVVPSRKGTTLCGNLWTQVDSNCVKLEVFSSSERITFDEAIKKSYQATHVGEQFGPSWSTHWFRLSYIIPSYMEGQEVHLLWDSNSEALVWSSNGHPLQGLTGGIGNMVRYDMKLSNAAKKEESGILFIEMACNGLFGNGAGGTEEPPDPCRKFQLSEAAIAVFRRDIWNILCDFTILKDMIAFLPKGNPWRERALVLANAVINEFSFHDKKKIVKCEEILRNFLKQKNGDGQAMIAAVGHCHIDTAWLWPYDETIRKCARSWATQLTNMEMFPKYKFACSQAQQYEWVKKYYPQLWSRISDKVKNNQFIPIGGTWVEMDCNLPNGESLIRQFLFGQKFFQKEFGVRTKVFWLPDTFGYAPQSGWDGSQVLAHFPPADTYNALGTVDEVLKSVSNNHEIGVYNSSLMLFGHGDGGGGPTPAMLESLSRMENIAGLPRVNLDTTPTKFFEEMEKHKNELPVWLGELYLEEHRGTLTSQSFVKRDNRRAEEMMKEIEALYSILYACYDVSYPHETINQLWKYILLNQFHDVLPGSSIGDVYKDVRVYYKKIFEQGKQLLNKGLSLFHSSHNSSNNGSSSKLQLRLDTSSIALVDTQVVSNGHESPVSLEEGEDSIKMSNGKIDVVLDKHGRLCSLKSRDTDRDFIAPGHFGNSLVLYEDVPTAFDAWNIESYSDDKPLPMQQPPNYKILSKGPQEVAVQFSYSLGENSTLDQVIKLRAGSDMLQFKNQCYWNESFKMLRVEFPTSIRSERVAYETQFGYVMRPTHRNTSWDAAKFEVCGHRFSDISEPGYGLALLNDSKYGHSAKGSTLRLTLLRSPKSPDKECDMGYHTFSYAVLPHTPEFPCAQVYRAADDLNRESSRESGWTCSTTEGKPSFSISVEAQDGRDGILISTLKKAEEENALILRIYESLGRHCSSVIRLAQQLPLAEVKAANLLEEEESQTTNDSAAISRNNRNIQVTLRPFEIVSLKLKLSSG
ncbi:alpha-mannosidase [Galdieria sulphuraria]|uniref:alpha-mannosidase n=1 Tax=Galdieria sulphuraria TaxID=130081 RepID=M2XXE2_GALSU|nr:alpha-mannosidase [Galdieria sulphuraria]EME28298.1 alpha-mannosidase [Galdieria sulphuraria]|eukprot:XP_005704818.1 alpha-mannosidase [Galdieria sulphuraria]